MASMMRLCQRKLIAGGMDCRKSAKRTGANGKDCIVTVPVGTIVKRIPDWNAEDPEELPEHARTEVLLDLQVPGTKLLVARGGKPGYGNARWATVPMGEQGKLHHRAGEPGEVRLLCRRSFASRVALVL